MAYSFFDTSFIDGIDGVPSYNVFWKKGEKPGQKDRLVHAPNAYARILQDRMRIYMTRDLGISNDVLPY